MKIYNLFLLVLVSTFLVLSQQALSSEYILDKFKDQALNSTIPFNRMPIKKEENQIPYNTLYMEYPKTSDYAYHLILQGDGRLDDTGLDLVAGNALSEYWIQEKLNPRNRVFIVSFSRSPVRTLKSLFISMGLMDNLIEASFYLSQSPQLSNLDGLEQLKNISNLQKITLELASTPIRNDQVQNLLSISQTSARIVEIFGLYKTQISGSNIAYIRTTLIKEMPWADVNVY